MDLIHPELLRVAVMLGVFAAVLGALFLFHKLWGSKTEAPRFRVFDLIITAAVSVFVGIHATNYWLTREEKVIEMFHQQYHDVRFRDTILGMSWLGAPIIKCPFDMWIYQEILHETKPDVLIETGTWRGGSAYYFASLFDLLGNGRVLTVDIEELPIPEHERIHYMVGSSTAPEILDAMKNLIEEGEKVMVVLDSDHRAAHVLDELRLYSDLVTVGNYLVVEDTHLNGRPVQIGEGDPWAAVQEFLTEDDRFEIDKSREKFGMSWSRDGWLKRVR